jgi:hypothetical protein
VIELNPRLPGVLVVVPVDVLELENGVLVLVLECFVLFLGGDVVSLVGEDVVSLDVVTIVVTVEGVIPFVELLFLLETKALLLDFLVPPTAPPTTTPIMTITATMTAILPLVD